MNDDRAPGFAGASRGEHGPNFAGTRGDEHWTANTLANRLREVAQVWVDLIDKTAVKERTVEWEAAGRIERDAREIKRLARVGGQRFKKYLALVEERDALRKSWNACRQLALDAITESGEVPLIDGRELSTALGFPGYAEPEPSGEAHHPSSPQTPQGERL